MARGEVRQVTVKVGRAWTAMGKGCGFLQRRRKSLSLALRGGDVSALESLGTEPAEAVQAVRTHGNNPGMKPQEPSLGRWKGWPRGWEPSLEDGWVGCVDCCVEDEGEVR